MVMELIEEKRVMCYNHLRRVEEGKISKAGIKGAREKKVEGEPIKKWIDCVQEL